MTTKKGTVRKVLLDQIIIDAGTQTRTALNEETIQDYKERMEAGDEFPPVIVFEDGRKLFFLADGFHRVEARRRMWCHQAASNEPGKTKPAMIEAEVRLGTRLEAVKFALGANTTNGLRRTSADKRKCVEVALKEFPQLSDRALADMCGVGNQLVGDVRKALQPADKPATDERVGRDGKTRSLSQESKARIAAAAKARWAKVEAIRTKANDQARLETEKKRDAEDPDWPLEPATESCVQAKVSQTESTADRTRLIMLEREIDAAWGHLSSKDHVELAGYLQKKVAADKPNAAVVSILKNMPAKNWVWGDELAKASEASLYEALKVIPPSNEKKRGLIEVRLRDLARAEVYPGSHPVQDLVKKSNRHAQAPGGMA